jgi:hypothetical protein
MAPPWSMASRALLVRRWRGFGLRRAIGAAAGARRPQPNQRLDQNEDSHPIPIHAPPTNRRPGSSPPDRSMAWRRRERSHLVSPIKRLISIDSLVKLHR